VKNCLIIVFESKKHCYRCKIKNRLSSIHFLSISSDIFHAVLRKWPNIGYRKIFCSTMMIALTCSALVIQRFFPKNKHATCSISFLLLGLCDFWHFSKLNTTSIRKQFYLQKGFMKKQQRS